MKPKSTLRHHLLLAASSLLGFAYAHAQSTSIWANSNVNGTPTSPLNWINPTQGTWTGGTPVSSNLNTIQFFANNTTALANTANPSTQTSNVDNGGSAFELGTLTLSGLASATANANLTETISGEALNFSAATGTINLNALNATRTITYNLNTAIQLGTASSAGALTLTGNGTSAFNIGGIISELQAGGGSLVKNGSSTVTLSAANSYTGTTTVNAGTLILTNTNGHTGATTLNAGTLNLTGAAGALTATSGLTFNGGGLTLTNTVAETGSGRVPDAAGMTSNGGALTYTNTSGANVYAETIGSVALTSGQMNFNLATNQTGAGSQTLTLSGLTQSGSGAATFSTATTAPNATKNRILVSGATQPPAGQISGAWATTGTAANNQNDYAVYDASGYIVPANIAASAETTWANATDAYTLSTPAKTATALTATRNLAALKASSTATVTSSGTTSGSPTFTIASGHSLNVGDPVVLSSFSGDLQNFSVGRLYYVESVTGTTFTLAATPGGAAINAGAAGRTVQFTGGLKLDSGINLGTTGILNSGNAPLAIGRTAAGGEITLPTAGAGNLYLTTGLSPVTSANSGLNGRISIEAPIVDNGGALTLVKNGAGVLRLQGTNTYTGGTVINNGTVIFTADNNFGSAATPITFNGSGALSCGPNTSWAFSSGGTINLSRPVTVNNGAIAGFYYNSPNTTMNITGAITGDGGITVGKDPVVTYGGGDGTITINAFSSTSHTFTGPLIMLTHGLTFNSLADGSGPMILGANFTYGSGALASLSVSNRLIDVRGSVTVTNSAGSTHTMTLGSISTTTAGAKTLTLSNASTNGAGFVSGAITNGAGTIAITKTGTGTFTLSGTNTYTGATTVSGGTLIVAGTGSTNTGAYAVTSATLRGTTPTAFGDPTNIGIGGSGILQLRGDANATFGKTTGGAAYTTSITATGATINVDQATVAGTDQIFTLGAQTITSTAATVNTTYTGANNSSLILGALTDTTVVNGTVQFTNSITGGGSLTLASFAAKRTGTPTLQFSGTGNTTVTGAITETAPMALTKNGAGTLTLGGASSHTGGTTVSAGTLTLNGSLADATMAVTGSTSIVDGTGTLTYNVNGLVADQAVVSGGGTINISGLSVAVNPTGSGLTESEYILVDATGGTITGTFAGLSGAPGYTLDYDTPNQVKLVGTGSASAYDTWATLKGLTGSNNGKGDDPDGDGKNNLYEFAFDGNPLSGANDGKIVGKVATVGGNQVLTLTLPVRTGATFSPVSGDQLSALIDGIYYRIEGDETLGAFADTITEVPTGAERDAIQAGLPGLSTGWTYRTFRAPGTVPTVSKVFLRAQISE